MRLSIDALPSGSLMSVVRVTPGPMVSFVMPAHKRQIRRYELIRRGGEGRYVKEYIDVPAILYTFGVDHVTKASLSMYVLKSVGDHTLIGKEVRIGNTYGNSRICWGHDAAMRIPTKMRDKIYGFWESPFNDDLTPYATFTLFESWLRQPSVLERFRDVFDKMERYRNKHGALLESLVFTTDNLLDLSSSDTERIIIQKYREVTAERENYYSNGVGTAGWLIENHPNEAVRTALSKRRELLERIRRNLSNKIDVIHMNRDAIRARLNDAVFYAHEISNAICDRNRGAVHSNNVSLRSKLLSMYVICDKPSFKKALMKYIRQQIALHVYRNYRDGDLLRPEYNKEKAEFDKKERDGWWGGGWVKYGEDVDLYKTAFGDRYVTEEAPIYAVAVVKRSALNRSDDALSNALYEYMTGYWLDTMYLPVWRLPDNSVVGYVDGVQYVGTLESNEGFVNLRLFNEEDNRILSAAKEIFG